MGTLHDWQWPPWDPAIASQPRYHFSQGTWTREVSDVVIEYPLTVFINGQQYVTAIITPTHVREWVLGFLASEGFIKKPDEISIYQHHVDEGQVWIRIPGLSRNRLSHEFGRTLTSCCGQSRASGALALDVTHIPPIPATNDLAISPKTITTLFERLSDWSRTQHTGGLHVAGLCHSGHLRAVRADVGRHNALDKIHGHCLVNNTNASQAVLLFSGRLSSEVIVKVAKMGCPVVASNAAPTSLGIEIAQTLGMTAIGFIRDGEFSVYSHPERVLGLG